MIGRRVLLGAAAGAWSPLARAARPPLAATPLSRADLPWWRARHEAKLREKRERGRIDLVFLGDSITQQYEHAGPPEFLDYRPVWERFYGHRHALNLGFIGDATSHLLWRIDNGEVADITPRAAVVLIGANNFGRLHWPASETVQGVEAVVAAARARMPDTHLIVASILPSDRGAWVAENTVAANRALATRLAGAERMRFVDLTGVFTTDGRIDLAAFADPKLPAPRPALHPDAAGQARMAAALEPALAPLLGGVRPA